MKQTKRIAVVALALVLMMSSMAISAYAANTTDTDYWYHTATTSSFPRIEGREKTDTSKVYAYISESTYSFLRVRAIGQSTSSKSCPTYENCTLYNGAIAPYVRCMRGTGYSISSMIYEYKWPYATLGFQSAGTTNDTVSGWWSPDSKNAHNTPLAP